ncbi:MAG: hypothetical protein OJF55_002185 [Rhodanobacteraceae bacterium]|nr:MAG: hypothetical protein OJF55_002185 [Rhodanobacteraceae bacterium]
MNVSRGSCTLLVTLAALVFVPHARATSSPQTARADVKQIPAVALSYDGRHLAWIVASADKTGLFLASPSGSNARRVEIPGDCREAGLRWARRWNELAVMTHCTSTAGPDRSAIWLLDVQADQPPRKVADFAGFAHGMQWTNDGKRIAFLYVPDASATGGNAVQRVATIPITGGEPEFVTPENLDVYEFSWTVTDSQGLAYTATPIGWNRWDARLYTQAADARATPRTIVDPAVPGPLHGRHIVLPRWSIWTSQIFFLGVSDERDATSGSIYSVPAGGGMPVDLTVGSGAKPSWFDMKGTVLTGTRRVDGSVEMVSYATVPHSDRPGAIFFSVPGSITDGRAPLSVSVSWRNRPRVAFVQSSPGSPPEIHAGTLGTQPPPAVTTINASLKPDIAKAEQQRRSDDNLCVHVGCRNP